MISNIRHTYNQDFTKLKYESFLSELHAVHPGAIAFRVSETPVFIPKQIGDQIIDTCDYIINQILDDRFINWTDKAVPPTDKVPGDPGIPQILTFDFGICLDRDGAISPQLIEMQGFPTLFGFQYLYPEILEKHFRIPDGFSNYFNGIDKYGYIQILHDVIIGPHETEEVILLEILPETQKTRIDFLCMKDLLGLETVCITKIKSEGNRLFYQKEGRWIRVKRIYNRMIFDELYARRSELGEIPDFTTGYDVEWIPHPDWFYRISKYTLPFLRHPNIPETWFLNEVKQLPSDLDSFVLKPLFSFAGQGVIIDLKTEDLEAIEDPSSWILQRKVQYADAIKTPEDPTKVEIRMMYLWRQGDSRPTLVTNLARLSKGKMIGVRYNQDKEWVGASVGYFEI